MKSNGVADIRKVNAIAAKVDFRAADARDALASDVEAKVREANHQGLPLRVFSGIECDIRKDGSMDLADDALACAGDEDVPLGGLLGRWGGYLNARSVDHRAPREG